MLRVYITIDTECREERIQQGKLQESAGYDKRVFGNFLNQQQLGIPFIVDTLKKYNHQGIFFVDPFGSHSFNNIGLKNTIHYLYKNNQDVQIHLHPIQRNAFWYTSKEHPESDHMCDYALDKQIDLISEAKQLLINNGAEASKLISLRAGHYSANDNLYQAMATNGIKYSSNYNLDYINKGICKLTKRTSNHNSSMQHSTGIIEYPITNFTTPKGTRHCQVTALSFSEMKQALEQAEDNGLDDFVIVTHSFEFLIESSKDKGYKNHVNRARFNKLCKYLEANKKRYSVEIFSEGNIQSTNLKSNTITTSRYAYLMRIIEQGIKLIQKKMLSI